MSVSMSTSISSTVPTPATLSSPSSSSSYSSSSASSSSSFYPFPHSRPSPSPTLLPLSRPSFLSQSSSSSSSSPLISSSPSSSSTSPSLTSPSSPLAYPSSSLSSSSSLPFMNHNSHNGNHLSHVTTYRSSSPPPYALASTTSKYSSSSLPSPLPLPSSSSHLTSSLSNESNLLLELASSPPLRSLPLGKSNSSTSITHHPYTNMLLGESESKKEYKKHHGTSHPLTHHSHSTTVSSSSSSSSSSTLPSFPKSSSTSSSSPSFSSSSFSSHSPLTNISASQALISVSATRSSSPIPKSTRQSTSSTSSSSPSTHSVPLSSPITVVNPPPGYLSPGIQGDPMLMDYVNSLFLSHNQDQAEWMKKYPHEMPPLLNIMKITLDEENSGHHPIVSEWVHEDIELSVDDYRHNHWLVHEVTTEYPWLGWLNMTVVDKDNDNDNVKDKEVSLLFCTLCCQRLGEIESRAGKLRHGTPTISLKALRLHRRTTHHIDRIHSFQQEKRNKMRESEHENEEEVKEDEKEQKGNGRSRASRGGTTTSATKSDNKRHRTAVPSPLKRKYTRRKPLVDSSSNVKMEDEDDGNDNDYNDNDDSDIEEIDEEGNQHHNAQNEDEDEEDEEEEDGQFDESDAGEYNDGQNGSSPVRDPNASYKKRRLSRSEEESLFYSHNGYSLSTEEKSKFLSFLENEMNSIGLFPLVSVASSSPSPKQRHPSSLDGRAGSTVDMVESHPTHVRQWNGEGRSKWLRIIIEGQNSSWICGICALALQLQLQSQTQDGVPPFVSKLAKGVPRSRITNLRVHCRSPTHKTSTEKLMIKSKIIPNDNHNNNNYHGTEKKGSQNQSQSNGNGNVRVKQEKEKENHQEKEKDKDPHDKKRKIQTPVTSTDSSLSSPPPASLHFSQSSSSSSSASSDDSPSSSLPPPLMSSLFSYHYSLDHSEILSLISAERKLYDDFTPKNLKEFSSLYPKCPVVLQSSAKIWKLLDKFNISERFNVMEAKKANEMVYEAVMKEFEMMN